MKTCTASIRNTFAGLQAVAGLTLNSRAVDFHVTTAQELQNALTLAAANGADDNIFLAAGYYTGNFNFNSAENRSLVLQGETGTTNTQITIDGAGTGRDMNLANTGTGNFTVKGITILRNCGSSSIGALRIAGGAGSTLLVEACRFMCANTAMSGIGLELISGQHAILTNCLVSGLAGGNSGYGVQVSFSGNLTVGRCTFVTNNNIGLILSGGAASLAVVESTFLNSSRGLNAEGTAGAVILANNNFVGSAASVYGANGNNQIAGNSFRNSNGGGCSFFGSGTLLVSNNVFAGNSGGCSLSGYTDTLVVNNTFTGNSYSSAPYGGAGGLSVNSERTIRIVGNTFTGNSKYEGPWQAGALYCGPNPSDLLISNNVFSGNLAGGGYGGSIGGGLCSDAPCNLVRNVFIGNRSFSGSGGGAYLKATRGTNIVADNVFRQNSASVSGGAIWSSGPALVLRNNLMVKNSEGGAIYVAPSSRLTLINNTVTDNSTAGNGGGLAVSVSGTSEVLDVYNNIIWGNSAAGNGADVWLAGTGSKKTFRYNNVHGMYGVWDIADNLLDVAPAFFDPVNGDYHLRSTSPCINAGTNGAPSIPAVDLDGNARTNAVIVDLGCYEFNNTAYHPADANQNWAIDATEYANYAAAWKNNQPWPTGPASIPADFVTRAGYLQNKGGMYYNDGAGAPLCWKSGTKP